MPPANAGGFGVFRPSAKKIEEEKPAQLEEEVDEELKKMYDEELLMDVNDPRNYETIERIRKMRNKQIRNILKHDVKIPLWETPSLRHKLIKMKFTDPELMSIDLPLREELIQKDKRLMKFLLDDYEIKLKTKIEKNTMEAEPVFIQTID
jgi:6-pyruvoyl-tetrahydropterin synthase